MLNSHALCLCLPLFGTTDTASMTKDTRKKLHNAQFLLQDRWIISKVQASRDSVAMRMLLDGPRIRTVTLYRRIW